MKLYLPLSGGESLVEWIIYSNDSFKGVDSVINEHNTVLLRNSSAFDMFGNIIVGKIKKI